MDGKLRTLLLLICCGMLVACRTDGAEHEVEPGMDLYAVAPETIIEVLFSSPDRKLYAYRWGPEGVFQVVTASRKDPVDHCPAGNGFLRWLRSVARVPIVKEAESQVDLASPDNWADLLIRDASSLEPISVHLLIPSANNEPVVVEFGSKHFATGIDTATLRSINSGCSALGVSSE